MKTRWLLSDNTIPERLMTKSEATIIATWRAYFQCSYSRIGDLGRITWGKAWLESLKSPQDPDTGANCWYGRMLVGRAEEVLGLDYGELDDMVMTDLLCLNCGRTEPLVLTYASDTAKECAKCEH